ncbi:MAG: hypothetical protein M3406_14805 [Chloroflexota bacterium]|nr:hypothetical protein [Chloroflexota bacterium]
MSVEYQSRADFAEALNRAVRELRLTSAGGRDRGEADDRLASVRAFVRDVAGVLAGAQLVEPEDLRPSYQLTSVVPWGVIRRVQADDEDVLKNLAGVYRALKGDKPLRRESFRTLEHIVEIAGSEANETFRQIAPA